MLEDEATISRFLFFLVSASLSFLLCVFLHSTFSNLPTSLSRTHIYESRRIIEAVDKGTVIKYTIAGFEWGVEGWIGPAFNGTPVPT